MRSIESRGRTLPVQGVSSHRFGLAGSRFVRGLLIAAIACGIVTAAAAAGLKVSAAGKPTLTIAISSPIGSIDPSKDGGTDYQFRLLTSEAIAYREPSGALTPGLATAWNYVKAPAGSGLAHKAFKITLRHNARFSDGTLVTAQAVKGWFDFVSKSNSPFANSMGPISSIDTMGKWTVVIHLKSPNPALFAADLLVGTWGVVQSPSCLASPAVLANQTCGAGPYMLQPSATVAGDHYTLVPNPYYYDKSRVKWGRIVFKVIGSPASVLQAMQAGQVDATGGDSTTATAAANAGLKVLHAPIGVETLFLDASGAKLKQLADVRVRQALNYAINRKVLAAVAGGKFAVPTSEISSGDGWNPAFANYYPYNPGKAKALLAAAGYPNGFALNPLTVGVGPPGGFADLLGQTIAKYWDAVGIQTTVYEPPTFGDYVQHLIIDPDPVFDLNVGPPGASMWTWWTLLMKPKSILNNVGGHGWNDPTINGLWVKGSRAANPSKYFEAIAARTVTQAYFVPLFKSTIYEYLNSKKVKNVTFGQYAGTLPIIDWSPA
jgi:peptide/nickel transport system substrate-binding protein